MKTHCRASHLCVLSLKDGLICSVQSRHLGLVSTSPKHTPLHQIYYVWPCAQHSSLPPLRAGPVLSEHEVIGPTKSEFGPEPPCTEQSCKMAPGRKSETCARLAVSAAGNPLRSAPGPTLTAGKHKAWRHAKRFGNYFCCFSLPEEITGLLAHSSQSGAPVQVQIPKKWKIFSEWLNQSGIVCQTQTLIECCVSSWSVHLFGETRIHSCLWSRRNWSAGDDCGDEEGKSEQQ